MLSKLFDFYIDCYTVIVKKAVPLLQESINNLFS